MKQPTGYTALCVLAVVVSALMVVYNLVGKEPFAVTVSYLLPKAGEGAVLSEGRETGSEAKEVEEARFPLDVNTATMEELVQVPRIGEVTAGNILEYREKIGGFTSLEQLGEVPGIGDKTYEVISPYLYVEGGGGEVLE